MPAMISLFTQYYERDTISYPMSQRASEACCYRGRMWKHASPGKSSVIGTLRIASYFGRVGGAWYTLFAHA